MLFSLIDFLKKITAFIFFASAWDFQELNTILSFALLAMLFS